MAPIAVVVDPSCPVVLLRGADPVLVGAAVSTVVEQLVGTAERDLVVDEIDAPRYEDDRGGRSLAPLVDAAATPPFLTDHRVVVGRHLGTFTTQEAVAPLLAYLADPLPSTRLVLVWEPHPTPQVRSGPPPKKLVDAVGVVGQIVDTDPGRNARDRSGWIAAQLDGADLRFDRAVAGHLAEWAGEDAGKVQGLLVTLTGAFAAGTKVGIADIEPYMGDRGDVAPWDLTDAVDSGDVARAIDVLHRMMRGGNRHALQILATLHSHVGRMLALDGADAADEKAAAAVLGIKGSTFPAKKALLQVRKVGGERVREMVALLAAADLDLKGARTYPPDVRDELVMEMLVARLASRSRR